MGHGGDVLRHRCSWSCRRLRAAVGTGTVSGPSISSTNNEEIPMKKSNQAISRRKALKSAAALTTTGLLFPEIVPRRCVAGSGLLAPSETVNVAGIGVGGMGGTDIRSCSEAGARIAALCDAATSSSTVEWSTGSQSRDRRVDHRWDACCCRANNSSSSRTCCRAARRNLPLVR